MSEAGPEEAEAVFAQLTLSDIGPFDARIASVGEGSITLCYLRTMGPVPEDGARGEVVIVGDDDGEPHQAVVHIEGWHGDGAVYVVNFRYRDVDHLENLVKTGVDKHVSMRAAFRVSPAAGEDIPVVMLKDERRYAAHLVDVSAKGIGLSLDGTERLATDDTVTMEFQLPGGVDITALQARICFAGERDGHPWHGLEFVVRDTASSQRAVARVVTYVMRRQREMLTPPSS